jgi:hypothetical protein
MVQLHNRLTDSQVKEPIERYLNKEIQRYYIQKVFGIEETRLFAISVKGARRMTAQSYFAPQTLNTMTLNLLEKLNTGVSLLFSAKKVQNLIIQTEIGTFGQWGTVSHSQRTWW